MYVSREKMKGEIGVISLLDKEWARWQNDKLEDKQGIELAPGFRRKQICGILVGPLRP